MVLFNWVSAGFTPSFPVSSRRSRVYFSYEITIPFLYLATSIPRKYFSDPRSLISNLVYKKPLTQISSTSFPMSIMSSTYTANKITFLSLCKHTVVCMTPPEPKLYHRPTESLKPGSGQLL